MIHILWPTIRPNVFKSVYNEWLNTADNIDNIQIYTGVNIEEHKTELSKYNSILTGNIKGVTNACTVLSKYLLTLNLPDTDIVILASDDMFPPKHWDTIILEDFKDFTGCVRYNDGLNSGPIITLPIMDIITLKKLNGIIYHPIYTHTYSDNELWDILLELKLLKDKRFVSPIFKHNHHSSHNRKIDNIDKFIISQEIFDKQIYLSRKHLNILDKLNLKILSILICSIPVRKTKLNRLLSVLNKQLLQTTEILIDDTLDISIGKKRSNLLNNANGLYVTFIDDDDLVSENYIKHILYGIKSGADVIGFKGIMTTNNLNPVEFIHSLQYDHWYNKNNIYYRCPNHLNPIRKDIALMIDYEDISNGEDKLYSDKLFNKLTELKCKEYFINNDILYYYLYETTKDY